MTNLGLNHLNKKYGTHPESRIFHLHKFIVSVICNLDYITSFTFIIAIVIGLK